MSNTWNRREFLAASAAAVPGLQLLGRGPETPPASLAKHRLGSMARGNGAAELPPRVIGLRTLGGDFRFDPAGLLIEPGERVIWLNMGDFHTTTAFHPQNKDLLAGGVPLRMPEGAEPWHSGILGLTAGTQFEHHFQVEGVYDYFCQPHYHFGMVGRIIVGAPHYGPALSRPLSELPEPAQRQMPSVAAIMNPAGRTVEWASRINGVLYLIANGTDANPAAGLVSEDVRRDAALQRVFKEAGNGPELQATLVRFADGVAARMDYETLVALADTAKGLLEQVRQAAS